MNLKESYIKNKRVIVEVSWTIIFFIFALQYLGIPDKYDTYIYWFLGIFLFFNIIIYLGFIKKELKEILSEKDD